MIISATVTFSCRLLKMLLLHSRKLSLMRGNWLKRAIAARIVTAEQLKPRIHTTLMYVCGFRILIFFYYLLVKFGINIKSLLQCLLSMESSNDTTKSNSKSRPNQID